MRLSTRPYRSIFDAVTMISPNALGVGSVMRGAARGIVLLLCSVLDAAFSETTLEDTADAELPPSCSASGRSLRSGTEEELFEEGIGAERMVVFEKILEDRDVIPRVFSLEEVLLTEETEDDAATAGDFLRMRRSSRMVFLRSSSLLFSGTFSPLCR